MACPLLSLMTEPEAVTREAERRLQSLSVTPEDSPAALELGVHTGSEGEIPPQRLDLPAAPLSLHSAPSPAHTADPASCWPLLRNCPLPTLKGSRSALKGLLCSGH